MSEALKISPFSIRSRRADLAGSVRQPVGQAIDDGASPGDVCW
ncbi:hypothetical protein [Amycolatopsis sp. CA-230715]|nr:hypothetical protein [Amycolatopsis sp. CA-230715]